MAVGEKKSVGEWQWNSSRLWSKIVKTGEDTCWEWLGSTGPNTNLFGAQKNGYGQMTQARRISHYIEFGESIAEFRLTHTCGNPMCVNPFHLEKKHNLRLGKECLKQE